MIRLAEHDDVQRIHELILELAVYERLEHKAVGSAEDLRRHLFGEPKYVEALVAEDGGRVVGFALFFPNYSTFLRRPGFYLEDLFVEPEHRGKGLGKALLREIARMAVERGYGRVDWAVLDWNEPSIQFYGAMGAVPLSDWITYRLEGQALELFAKS
jgi:GNAT superfamily N-acetyltransferase